MAKGRLYIVPVGISEVDQSRVLPLYNAEVVGKLRCFAVERLKTARQFLRKMDREFPIDDSEFFEQNKHDQYSFDSAVIERLISGIDVGLMSESGYPAVADPGYQIVAKAQQGGIEVVPLVGPSSILMGLAASGLNGQGFSFNGYLPVKEPERSKQLKFYASLVQKTGHTQIFIETPYRNGNFFQDVLKHCPSDLKMCVAFDIAGANQRIVTKKISSWKNSPFKFDKTPCIFLIGN